MIKEERRPKVLLLGNGINRSFNGDSWDSIVDAITKVELNQKEKDILSSMSFPLRAIVATDNDVQNGVKSFVSEMIDIKPSEDQKIIFKDLLSLGFDAVLTTNYSYDVEKTIEPDFYIKMNSRSKYRIINSLGNTIDKQFGIYSCLNVGGFKIWHIHGESAKPNSVVLGHRYYGKLVSRINSRLTSVFSQYKASLKYGNNYIPESWIDYLMISDVYIVGLGLDLSEMDLWWLLDIKQAHKEDIGNSKVIWFEPNLNDDSNMAKALLARCYGIDIQTEAVKKNEYREYYAGLSQKIKTYMENEDNICQF